MHRIADMAQDYTRLCVWPIMQYPSQEVDLRVLNRLRFEEVMRHRLYAACCLLEFWKHALDDARDVLEDNLTFGFQPRQRLQQDLAFVSSTAADVNEFEPCGALECRLLQTLCNGEGLRPALDVVACDAGLHYLVERS